MIMFQQKKGGIANYFLFFLFIWTGLGHSFFRE